jgi:hypothetical protein
MKEIRMINCWSEASARWSMTSHFSPDSEWPCCKSRSAKFYCIHHIVLILAPSDFYLFRPFKNFLSGKRFQDQNALFKLVKWWVKCLIANGDYAEK